MQISSQNSVIHFSLITVVVVLFGCAPKPNRVNTIPHPARLGRPTAIPPSTGPAADVATGTDLPELEASLTLRDNVPNPFNPATELSFALPAGGGAVALVIYGLDGRVARRLVVGDMTAGEHKAIWRGRDDRGRRLPSGVYLASLRRGREVRVRKLVMVE